MGLPLLVQSCHNTAKSDQFLIQSSWTNCHSDRHSLHSSHERATISLPMARKVKPRLSKHPKKERNKKKNTANKHTVKAETERKQLKLPARRQFSLETSNSHDESTIAEDATRQQQPPGPDLGGLQRLPRGGQGGAPRGVHWRWRAIPTQSFSLLPRHWEKLVVIFFVK